MTSPNRQITVISGDGIGQEVVDATLKILERASTPLTWAKCQAGEKIFKQGISSGVPISTLDSIKENGVVLKGPLTTPVGYGERSANVFLRKAFGLFANVRPVKQYPNIPSIFSEIPIDLVVIRENIEDL
ncbi:MAG: isocitrate/isopropylmalate family dehydrogenase, partial [Candidatus Margulisiibacteriota bacterium]